MKITHYIPENPLLKPLIAGIYLLKRNSTEPSESYLAFPGTHQFITMNREVVCKAKDHQVVFMHQAGHPPSSLLIANFGVPRLWSYEGQMQEWNIGTTVSAATEKWTVCRSFTGMGLPKWFKRTNK